MRSSWGYQLAAFCSLSAIVVVLWHSGEWQGMDNQELVQAVHDDSADSALHHLSSSSLVQRAAADCAADSKCIPTVDELVNRAAAACASDPGCVCDWAKYPKKCFLSEVARHKQLTEDAKELVSVLRNREEKKARQLQSLKEHNVKFDQLLASGRNDLHNKNIDGAKKDLVKAEVQHQLSERLSDGKLDLHIPIQQSRVLEQFARQIVSEERARTRKTAKSAVSTAVTKQLAVLSSQIKLLMKKVASRNNARAPRTVDSSHSDLPLTTAEQIRALTEDVAQLTGKLGRLQNGDTRDGTSMADQSGGRLQQLSDFPPRHEHRVEIQRERALTLKHQERALAAALKRGKAAVDDGNPSKAKTALAEVQYYRKALARLRGDSVPCPACETLKQEVSALSSELLTPASSTELSQTFGNEHRSATSLEKSFDSYLSVGDRALVHDRVKLAQKALSKATGRFAELETMKLPGADAVIKHEMRDALRALRNNIRTQEASDGDSHHESGHGSSGRLSRRSRASWRHQARARISQNRHERPHKEQHLARKHLPAAADERRARRPSDADADRDETPGSAALLRKMLARPGYYDAKTLRLATEGLKTATLEADGTLEALSADNVRRIKEHFSQS